MARAEDFQRDESVERRLEGLVDPAHAAVADLLDNFVAIVDDAAE